MKKILLIVATFLMCYNTNAQMGLLGKKPAEQVEQLKERPLLVVLGDEEVMDVYNENIKKAIDEVWTFCTDIRYISKDEWRKLAKDKDEAKKYAQLYFTARTLNANAPGSSLVIGLLENKISTNFYYTGIGLADLTLALHNIQTDLEMGTSNRTVLKNQQNEFSEYLTDSLQHKTLYIDKAVVGKKFLKQIDDIYKYDYKLVSKEEIDNAIINKDPNVLFIREFVRAQRPMTKTRRKFGETNQMGTNTQISSAASMYVGYNLVYKALDLKAVGIAGLTGTGSLSMDMRETGKLKIKGIKTLLKYIK